MKVHPSAILPSPSGAMNTLGRSCISFRHSVVICSVLCMTRVGMLFVRLMVDSPGKVMGSALISPLNGPKSSWSGKIHVHVDQGLKDQPHLSRKNCIQGAFTQHALSVHNIHY